MRLHRCWLTSDRAHGESWIIPLSSAHSLETGWAQDMLCTSFINRLSETLQDPLPPLELQDQLVIAVATHLDHRLAAWEAARGRPFHSRLSRGSGQRGSSPPGSWRHPPWSSSVEAEPTASSAAEEPMQLGRARLTREERERWQRGRLCLYCGQAGHQRLSCPELGLNPLRVRNTRLPIAVDRALPSVTLSSPSVSVKQGVLVDSGADADLMDQSLASRLALKLLPLDQPLRATALNGQLLWQVTHRTESCQLTFSDGHTEQLSFLVIATTATPVVLGFPWLRRHN